MRWIDSVSTNLMNRSLDGLWARQQAIQDNIANHETPGYKRKYVTFEDELRAAIDSSQSKKSEILQGIKNTKIQMGVAENEVSRNDGNSISVEYENIEFARAQLQYRTLTQQMTANFSRLSAAISGTSK